MIGYIGDIGLVVYIIVIGVPSLLAKDRTNWTNWRGLFLIPKGVNTKCITSVSDGRGDDELRDRHIKCLRQAAEGLKSEQIGRILGYSKKTVEKYLAEARDIIGVSSTIAAVVWAIKKNLI
jgi:DNA-binding CsgD family transcriptional regulator